MSSKGRIRHNGSARTKPLTFSWVYPVVLTHRCAWRCGYCPYPTTAGPSLPSKGRLQEELARARKMGLLQVRLTGGESLENIPEIASTIRYYGHNTLVEYLKSVIGEAAQNGVRPPLFPELDLGGLSLAQMQQLRPLIFTLRLYLDSMDERLSTAGVHSQSFGKWPRQRVTALVAAGQLSIPVNSGIMAGIGETAESRGAALRTLADIAQRYGHIQSVAIHPFVPMARTPMSDLPRPSVEMLLETVALAREILPETVEVQFPIVQYPERVLDFVKAGATDLGDFELTGDPAMDGPVHHAYKVVRDGLSGARMRLADRLSLFPRYSSADWLQPRYQKLLAQRNAPAAGEPLARSA